MANPGLSTLADIAGQLPQEIPGATRQYNRLAVTASTISTEAGQGKNIAHDAEMDGALAGSYAEGTDVLTTEFNVDVWQLAVLNWANYRSSFQVSENKIDAAMTSRGGFEILGKFFAENVMSSTGKLASVQNVDSIVGTGVDGSGNPTIVGLFGGALSPTGTYAGINRSAYPLWAGNSLGNGGVGRPLSIDLLNQGESAISFATGEGFDCIWTSYAVVNRYKNLFEIETRQVRDLGSDSEVAGFDAGTSKVSFMGIPVLRDRDFDKNGQSGSLVMGNSKFIKRIYLPPTVGDGIIEGEEVELENGESTNGDGIVTSLNMPYKVFSLFKGGDSYKVTVKNVCNQLVTRPAAFCTITDLLTV